MFTLFYVSRRSSSALSALLASAALAATGSVVHAAVGQTKLAALGDDAPVTLFYPTDAAEQKVQRGPFELSLAVDAPPATARSNGRLVVISHGSGGNAWVHADLARALVNEGFVVAFPLHRGDNSADPGKPGPDSWKQRPAEVSRAIDAVARDPRFAAGIDFNRVGMYGMSAGGHTALSMAGGAWSPGNFRRHCEAHIDEDFATCVGLIVRQSSGWVGALKRWVALAVIRSRFDDDTLHTHHDPRVAAVVAGVPAASDFELSSLANPRVPLAFVTAGRDAWLVPKFHSERVLAACTTCIRLADMPSAGHGALLSPFPPGISGLLADLLNDPPGFDRSQLPAVDARIVGFFRQHLIGAPASTAVAP